MSTVIHNQQVQLEFSKAVEREMNYKIAGVNNVLAQTRNELGQETTKVIAISGEKEQLKQLLQTQADYKALAERLDKLDIKVNDLHSVTSLSVTTSGEFETVVKDSIVEKIVYRYVGDTLKKETVKQAFKVINYVEPAGWFTMTGTIKGDTMKFNPTFKEEYQVVIHEEKKPKRYWLDLFRKKQTIGTVFSKNPYSKTNEMKVIVQKRERKGLFSLF